MEQQVGRLALRHEGDEWNAYYALADTMDGALKLASIKLSIVRNEKYKMGFMRLMADVVAGMIEEITGHRPAMIVEKRE